MGSGAVWGSGALQARQLADKQWHDVQQRGVLRIGIDPGWQPFSFYTEKGWVGLDADLAQLIAQRLHVQLQTIPVGYDSMYDALHLWQVDVVMSAVVVDASRSADYTYTDSYFDGGVRLVVPASSTLRAINGLGNQRVAVALGSEGDRLARYYERRLAGMLRVTVADDRAALRRVEAGTADAALVDALSFVAHQQVTPRPALVGISVTPQPYAIAVRKDNPWLLDELNRTLRSVRQDGSLDTLIARWIHE
jgi:polar amino acid transport system substrate-binding protein